MRNLRFTRDQNNERSPFASLITFGPAFQFGMSDIGRIREEMAALVDKLSKLYLPLLTEQENAAKKAKRIAKLKKSSSENASGDTNDATGKEEFNAVMGSAEKKSNVKRKGNGEFIFCDNANISVGNDTKGIESKEDSAEAHIELEGSAELLLSPIEEKENVTNSGYKVAEREEAMRDYKLSIEYKHLKQNCPGGVYLVPSFDNLRLFHGVIFVQRGTFTNGIFKFTLSCPPRYNDAGMHPILKFSSYVYNPHVQPESGEVDLCVAYPE